jgi:hypothetical protein
LGFEAGIDHGPRSDASVTRWPLLVFHLGHPWKGRNEPHCQDRRWVTAWSPEQISHRLKPDFPDDESMRISHEAIYQALYIRGRGALKRELIACLRTGRALRVPRARTRQTAWAHVTPDVVISERPAEVEGRAVPGHWEGDLIIGLQRSAIGTLVERTTRFTMLIRLPREEGYGLILPTKNGPALAGYGAVTTTEEMLLQLFGGRDLEEVFDADQMHSHPEPGAVGIMCSDRAEDVAVLVDGSLLGAFFDRPAEESSPCCAPGDGFDEAGENRVRCRSCHESVEFTVGNEETVVVVGRFAKRFGRLRQCHLGVHYCVGGDVQGG